MPQRPARVPALTEIAPKRKDVARRRTPSLLEFRAAETGIKSNPWGYDANPKLEQTRCQT